MVLVRIPAGVRGRAAAFRAAISVLEEQVVEAEVAELVVEAECAAAKAVPGKRRRRQASPSFDRDARVFEEGWSRDVRFRTLPQPRPTTAEAPA